MTNAQGFIESWFPVNIMVCDATDFLPLMRDLFANFEFLPKHSEKYPNGYTTFFEKPHHLDNLPGMQEFGSFVQRAAETYFEAHGVLDDDHFVEFPSVWLNRMGCGASHPRHVHGNAHLCATYYVNSSDDSSKLLFHNPMLTFIEMSNLIPKKKSSYAADAIVQHTPSAGKLLIWPAYLEHEVQENKSQTFRDSMSMNIRLCARS